MDSGGAEPRRAAEPDRGSASVAVEITYYTDPLCCWSWAFEPQWRRLRYGFAGRIAWRCRMGGMIHDWQSYGDPLNAIHRPAQMGPLWLQAKHVSGMAVEPNIWIEDPPASSWPACRAVKAAELQSAAAAGLYLRRLREAVMVEMRNIARPEVLRALGQDCAEAFPGRFDAARFAQDLDGPAAEAAFRDDLKEGRFRGIGRYPALVIRRPGSPESVLVGWRPYAELRDAVAAVAPDLGPERRPESAAAYRAYWRHVTDREIEEALSDGGADVAPRPEQA